MAFDSAKVADRLRAKVKMEKGEGTAAEEKADAEGGETDSETSPGAMALKAIKAGNAEALEEAIKACVGKSY